MKKLVLPILLTSLSMSAIAQNNSAPPTKQEAEALSTPDNKVFSIVEKNPEFPGGQNALNTFLAENLKYPQKAQRDGIEGKILISFVVEKDGTITEVMPIKPNDPELLLEEAIRVTKLMPKWKPGIMDGKPVRVKFVQPYRFKLTDPKE